VQLIHVQIIKKQKVKYEWQLLLRVYTRGDIGWMIHLGIYVSECICPAVHVLNVFFYKSSTLVLICMYEYLHDLINI